MRFFYIKKHKIIIKNSIDLKINFRNLYLWCLNYIIINFKKRDLGIYNNILQINFIY